MPSLRIELGGVEGCVERVGGREGVGIWVSTFLKYLNKIIKNKKEFTNGEKIKKK